MASDYFYSALPTLQNFVDITDPRNFVSVPADWLIVITDIVGSTQAIERGKYKDVNLLGACSIIALLNIARDIELPFVFGGDGASILIPPMLLSEAKQALLATQELARREFSLELRVGIVPVAEVVAAGYPVDIAKMRISENYSQGVFMGGGLTHATHLVKDRRTADRYALPWEGSTPKADFSGLECRWQDIPSQYGEIVSLLVLATGRYSGATRLYKDVIEQIQRIYGSDEQLRPIAGDRLQLCFNSNALMGETKIRARSHRPKDRYLYLLRIGLENLLGWLFIRFRLRFRGVNWGRYRNLVAAATDYRKFDDMLRMVIAGDTLQREKLTHYLETQYQEGKLVYGVHISDRALMTCLVFERNGRQVHFVDGADGGYTLAAKAMKQRIWVQTS